MGHQKHRKEKGKNKTINETGHQKQWYNRPKNFVTLFRNLRTVDYISEL